MLVLRVFAGFALTATAAAQVSQALYVPGAQGRERLGEAVWLDGDTLAAGAPGDSSAGPGAGAVYVYTQSGSSWSVQAQLLGSDTAPGDALGTALEVAGDRLAVGAPLTDSGPPNAGAVYVFERRGAGWIQTAKLVASDREQGDRFGNAVALDGDRIVVGAPRDDGVQADVGSVYVFDQMGGAWVQSQKLTAHDADLRHRLGTSVDVDGDRIVAGAPRAAGAADNSGAVYVYELAGTWAQVDKAFCPGGTAGDRLGRSVHLEGDRMAVGAPGADQDVLGAGQVTLFERMDGAWVEVASMRENAPAAKTRLGYSVRIAKERVFAGAPAQLGRGRAVAFGAFQGQWSDQRRYRADPGSAEQDMLGTSIAVQGRRSSRAHRTKARPGRTRVQCTCTTWSASNRSTPSSSAASTGSTSRRPELGRPWLWTVRGPCSVRISLEAGPSSPSSSKASGLPP